MHTVNPTQLRKTLFSEISLALHGEPVLIKTRTGNALLISEKLFRSAKKNVPNPSPMEPKIPGEIVGDLESADEELLNHLELPRED